MNGYGYPSNNGSSDNNRQQPPPSIPSLNQLQIGRPVSAASPAPSQLPPLHQGFQPSSAHLPPLQRQSINPSQGHHQTQKYEPQKFETFNPGFKTANPSYIAPQAFGGPAPPPPYQSFGQHYSQGPQHSFPPPALPSYQNGDSNHSAASQSFPGPLAQHPHFSSEPGHDQRGSNLLPPFNPQPQPSSQEHPQLESDPRLHHQQQDQRPLPVVGHQGRRGVLPSAPGRPSVHQQHELPGRGMGTIVQKGADGKFACQYCSKVYLHLKHLKRHHLRHTGERPYQCSLCKETFCRSDILKRHFQKCSIRRGNPTGATHLTHAQAHLQHRRDSQTPSQAASSVGGPQTSGGAPAHVVQSVPPSSYRPALVNGALQSSVVGENGSGRSSRSSSIPHRPNSSADKRESFASTAGTAPQTGQTSLNTSPSSSNGEDKKHQYTPHQPMAPRDLPSAQYSNGVQHSQQHTPQPPQHQQGQQQQPPQQPQHPQQPPHQHQAPGQPQHHQYQQQYYGSAPQQFTSTSQPENFPSFGYGQTNGTYYPQHNEAPRYNEQHWNNYQQYFQPGSQDPVMSYQQ